MADPVSILQNLCDLCRVLDIRSLIFQSRVVQWWPKHFDPYERAFSDGLFVSYHESLLHLRKASQVCDLCAKIWQCFTLSTGLPNDMTDAQLVIESAGMPSYLVYLDPRLEADRLPRLAAVQRDEDEATRVLALFEICTSAGGDNPDDCPIQLARLLFPDSGSPECLSLARLWLQECRTKHVRCKRQIQVARRPSRVIDLCVDPPLLVCVTDKHLEYMALSYSWGGETALMLTMKSERDFFNQGIPKAALPPTISDFLMVTRAMGIQYAWVDSLCIQQDSKQDFLSETTKMRDIYKGAVMTVQGSKAAKISDRLFHSRDVSSVISLSWNTESGKCSDTIHLQETSQALKCRLNDSPVNTRGWCLQESLLAVRSLWIGEQQMVFECSTSHIREASNLKFTGPELGHNKETMYKLGQLERKWLKACHISALRLPPVIRIPSLKLSSRVLRETHSVLRAIETDVRLIFLPFQMEKGNKATVYDYWRQIVHHYTERRFTKVTDVLPALSGLADAFSRATGEEYLAGLWKGDLRYSLNWSCRSPVEFGELDLMYYFTPELTFEPKEAAKQKIIDAYRKVGYLAPSWSWASVIHGRIMFSPCSGDDIFLQAHVQTLWTAVVIDAKVVRSTQDPYGSVSGGYLVIRGPFASFPHPLRESGGDCSLPTLHKFIRLRAMSHGARFEFDLKHKPFGCQNFALLQTGAYRVPRIGDKLFPRSSTRYDIPIALPNENQPMLQMLLIESCEDSSVDCALVEHVPRLMGRMQWRRLCHFQIPMTEMKVQSDEKEYGAGIRRDLSSQVWAKKTICLV
jgi:hypothetical protein